ncbi:MAG: carbon-nitrogen hydrolase family protein [Candidatus Zixiibacteriota bacterium]
MVICVAALQYPLGGPITLEDKLHLFRRRPDFVCLPEYFPVRAADRTLREAERCAAQRRAELARLSQELQCVVIGGSMPQATDGGYANTTTIFDRGEVAGSYQKVNPYGREEERGIVPGREYRVFVLGGVRIGVLICADVLSAEAFAAMHRLGAEVIFVPTVSPFRETDTITEKDRRDAEIFVAGAQKARAYVVKTCGVGTLFGGRLQGRSGIFAPWGILDRVNPDGEDRKMILAEHLDIEEIREFKRLMDPAGLADDLPHTLPALRPVRTPNHVDIGSP